MSKLASYFACDSMSGDFDYPRGAEDMTNDSTNRIANIGAMITTAAFILLIAGGGLYTLRSMNAEPEPSAESVPLVSTEIAASDLVEIDVEPEIVSNVLPVLPTVDLSEVPVVSDAAIAPQLNPEMNIGNAPTHEFEIYEVQRGDTPNLIADRFGIEATTLLGGNPWLSQESSQLQAGVEILILPVDGLLHEVQLGDTLESISAQYGVPVEEIIAYEPNNLEFPYRLYRDTQILVPGAVRELFIWTPPSLPEGQSFAVVGTGTFVSAVNGGCVSQYFWPGHPGLDVALPEGNSVVSMDRGTVTYAAWASGIYYDYGNLIVVNHGNGYETFYAHLNVINVFPGQVVEQGQFIGTTGNTGRSTGPHIHLEIRLNNFRDDPTWYIGAPGAC